MDLLPAQREAKARLSGKDMPFDGKRMIYGGFQVIVDL